MEKYYDGDQEAFFREAHVINPFNKPVAVARPKLKRSGTEECEICFSFFPPSVSTHFEFHNISEKIKIINVKILFFLLFIDDDRFGMWT